MVRRQLGLVALALIGAAWFWFLILPWPILVRWREPRASAFMDRRVQEARQRDDDFEFRYTWVPLDRIARNLQRAVVIAEDGNFFEHRGIDWAALGEELGYREDGDFSWFDPDDVRGVGNAIVHYYRNSDDVRGRSTITQQLAKNLYFSSNRSVLRKLEEFLVARRLEWFLPKERILELYLNIAEWGPGIFGAEAAARHYYGRSAANLNLDQAVTLAVTLPHPLTSNPSTRPGRMASRKASVLRLMGR
ncbi:MAG: transglycosylase domain-containing protein [Longimicrobiales bacterium]